MKYKFYEIQKYIILMNFQQTFTNLLKNKVQYNLTVTNYCQCNRNVLVSTKYYTSEFSSFDLILQIVKKIS